jgi:hypothetical protein
MAIFLEPTIPIAARTPSIKVAIFYEQIFTNTALNNVAMIHEPFISFTARTPSKYVAMFHEPFILFSASKPHNYVKMFH